MYSRWEYRRWRQRRRRRRLFLLLLVAAAAAGLSAGHPFSAHPGRSKHHPASPPASRISSRTTASPHPASLRWTSFHGISLPVSTVAGPHDIHAGLASGFTNTPQGAVLAAVNISVRTAALWGTKIFQPTIAHQVTGPDTAALLANDTRDYAAMQAAGHLRHGQPAGRGYAAIAAYRLDAYTLAAATVDVVTEGPSSSGASVMAATRVQVVWARGDWRVMAPPAGDWTSSSTPIKSLSGYTTFSSQG